MDVYKQKEIGERGETLKALKRIADALEKITVILYQMGGGRIRSGVSGDLDHGERTSGGSSADSHAESTLT